MSFISAYKSKHKNFIFDFDMTLVDTSRGSAICYEAAITSAGGLYNPEDVSVYMSEFLDATYSRIKNPTIPYEKFEEIFYKYSHSVMAKQSRLYPDAMSAINMLRKDKNLAIVTNKDKRCVMQILQFFGIGADLFDTIICCDDVQKRKPDPEALFLCLQRMGWLKFESLYIGDSQTDRIFARNAGVDFVRISRNANNSPSESGDVISNLTCLCR